MVQLAPHRVSIPLSSITGNIQVNTLGGSDTLTIDFSGGNPIPAGGITFNGGESAGDHDTLKLVGYSLTTADGVADVTVNHTATEAGNVVLAGLGTINFSQIEPLTLGGDAADLVINLPAGPNTVTVLSDDGGTGDPDGNTADYSAIDDATFEYTQFKNPTNTLKINRGSASDNITVQDLVVSGFSAGLTIGAAANPFYQVTFAGPVTVAADKSLSADAAGTIGLPNTTSDLAASGTGTVTLSTARDLTLANGASVGTVYGNITLAADSMALGTAPPSAPRRPTRSHSARSRAAWRLTSGPRRTQSVVR